MKKITLALSLAGLTLAGAAIANEHGRGMDPFGDKTVTRAESANHAAQMFARFDANKDGKLDAADRAAHKGERFTQADTNKDGMISREEFTAAHQNKGQDGERGKMRGGHGRHMAKMMLHMADANKDRAVSREEFTAAHQAMFDRADADKDGKVTAAERKAAHAKMREHMKTMKAKHRGQAQAAPGHESHEGH
jgi:Ca2+-binding EF-hand superfamily protein